MKVIIARHGHCDCNGELVPVGVEQMHDLSQAFFTLGLVKRNDLVAVFSSTAKRAIDSMSAIIDGLGDEAVVTRFDPLAILLTEDECMAPDQAETAKHTISDAIGDKHFDVLIVVSHYGLVPFLVKAYSKCEFKPEFGIIRAGEAMVIRDDGKKLHLIDGMTRQMGSTFFL